MITGYGCRWEGKPRPFPYKDLTAEQMALVTRIVAKRGLLRYLGQGCDRWVFLVPPGNVVLKLEKMTSFKLSNKDPRASQCAEEARNYHARRQPIAACREVIPRQALLMRYVLPCRCDEGARVHERTNLYNVKMNDWAQIGLTEYTNRFVIYDAGVERG